MATRCLIVDDNAWFLRVGRELLERQGLPVVGVASTGAEALGQAERLSPDVVLVDISLGKESGLQVACRLTEVLSEHATVILISTRSHEDVADLIADCPADAFLPKTELSAAAIRKIVAGA